MIVISQKVVKAAGLDFPTAIGLMQPAEGELVVCIHNVHEPQERPTAPAEPLASPGVEPISSPVVAPDSRSDEPRRLHAAPLTAEVDTERLRHRLAQLTAELSDPHG